MVGTSLANPILAQNSENSLTNFLLSLGRFLSLPVVSLSVFSLGERVL